MELIGFLILSLVLNAYFLKKLYVAQNYEKYSTGNQIVMFANTLESLTVRIDDLLKDPKNSQNYTWLVAQNEVMKKVMLISNRYYTKLAPTIISLGDQTYQVAVKYFYNNDNEYSEEELLVLRDFNSNLKSISNEFNNALKDIRSSDKDLLDFETDLAQFISSVIEKNKEEFNKLKEGKKL